jgi:copper resistance protein C
LRLSLRSILGGMLPAALLAVPATVLAHAELVTAEPAADAVLEAPPAAVTITFDDELDADGSELVVIGPAGDDVWSGGVDLDVAERNVLTASLGTGADGEYIVEWTAQSADGHQERGSYAFRVGTSTGTTAPDTALSRSVPLAPIGAALLAGAAVAALGRRRAATPALLVVALIVVGCVTEPASADCEAETATLALELEVDSLEPDDPAVCRDQEVTLEIDSEVDGVFHVHGYDEALPATEVTADETTTLTFTANRSGQFPIEFHGADDPTGVEIGVLTIHEP